MKRDGINFLFKILSLILLFYLGVEILPAGGNHMFLSSPAFQNKGNIPQKYAMPRAGGKNISPPLNWNGIPPDTKSLVLICVDIHPIANKWIHWVIINLPPEIKGLPEGASPNNIPSPGKELLNSYGFKGWGGPQPPPGTGAHSYVFKLYALKVSDIKIKDNPGFDEIIKTIKPYIIAEAELIGFYER